MRMGKNRFIRELVLLLVFGLAVPRLARPCSSFVVPGKGFFLFGTNYDNYFAPGLLFINKRNVRKTGWEAGTTGLVATWTSRYGSVTISCAGYQLAWGGMNEEGLVFSTMFLNGTQPPAPDKRPPLAGACWWQYVLDTCATIEDLKKAEAELRMTDTEDHYLVCDRTGACAVIECLGGQMVIRDGKDLPLPALTNAAYRECLNSWDKKRQPNDEPYDSFNRFSRLASALAKFKIANAAASVDDAFGLLADVAHPTNTRWSFVCDTGNRVFYLKTYKNPKIRFVDLKKIDFGCGRPSAMLDAHAGLEGDMAAAFRDYSHTEVLNHMLQALAYFRPETPREQVGRILGLFESFSCGPATKR
jgi:penicillin V acylase-like amidase (Ntn superfamily)